METFYLLVVFLSGWERYFFYIILFLYGRTIYWDWLRQIITNKFTNYNQSKWYFHHWIVTNCERYNPKFVSLMVFNGIFIRLNIYHRLVKITKKTWYNDWVRDTKDNPNLPSRTKITIIYFLLLFTVSFLLSKSDDI